jgi:hypothetical protein
MFFLFRFTSFVLFLLPFPPIPPPFFTIFLIVLLYLLFPLPLTLSRSLILFFVIPFRFYSPSYTHVLTNTAVNSAFLGTEFYFLHTPTVHETRSISRIITKFLHPQTIKSEVKVMSGYRFSQDLYGMRISWARGGEGTRLYFGNTPVRHLLCIHVRRPYVTSRNSTANQLACHHLRLHFNPINDILSHGGPTGPSHDFLESTEKSKLYPIFNDRTATYKKVMCEGTLRRGSFLFGSYHCVTKQKRKTHTCIYMSLYYNSLNTPDTILSHA